MIVSSVLYGLLFSVLFTAVIFGGALFARDFGVHNYPAAIRERYGPKSDRGRRVTVVVGIVIGVLIVAVLTASLRDVRSNGGGPLDFGTAFASAEITLMTFNVYDLIVLDWLLFNLLRPAIVVLPGTEGMPEYRDWAFHAVGFARGVVIVTVLSLLAALAAILLEAIF